MSFDKNSFLAGFILGRSLSGSVPVVEAPEDEEEDESEQEGE